MTSKSGKLVYFFVRGGTPILSLSVRLCTYYHSAPTEMSSLSFLSQLWIKEMQLCFLTKKKSPQEQYSNSLETNFSLMGFTSVTHTDYVRCNTIKYASLRFAHVYMCIWNNAATFAVASLNSFKKRNKQQHRDYQEPLKWRRVGKAG